MIEKKSDKLSEQYRNEGNSNYMKKEHFNAIISYNKALCYAVSSENLALAYGNRSAMYFELKRYQKCLENITWARENNYPSEKVQKLNEREEKCKKMIDTEFDASSFIKLSYPANPKIPFIVECLELRTTEEFGRGIYTTQDLKPGDIIAFDKPVFYTVNSTSQYVCCCNCLKYQMQSLIPCLKTASLMFCTVECRDKAYASFPDISCMLPLSEEEKAFPIQVARLLAQAENAFNGHDNLMKYLKTNEYKKSKKTIFDYDFSNPNDPSYEMNRMKAALSLISYTYDYTYDEVKKFSKKVAKGNKHIEEFLKHACGVFVKNIYQFKLALIIVLITLPLGSLFNHSCLANIAYFNNNGTAVYNVTRSVKAGEQLFSSYFGFLAGYKKLLDRKIFLQMSHHVICRCVYCVENVNTDEILSRISDTLKMIIQKSRNFYDVHPLASYKELSVEIFKQLKKNQELIIKNADNLYSPEFLLLPEYNGGFFKLLGNFVNYPCIVATRSLREALSPNVP